MKKSKMKLNLHWRNFLVSKFVLCNFLMLVASFSIFFLIFVVFTYRNSRQIIEEEFISSSRYSTEVIANSVDDYLMDIRYIAATLDTNDLVKTFFHSDNPDTIITGIYPRIHEHLKAYVNSFASIDSIYLYSEKSKTLITATERLPLSYFTDTNWMDGFTESPAVYTVFPRAKNNSYPFVLSLMKQIKINSYNAAIVININLSNLPNLIEVKNNAYQKVFIVTDDNKILFQNNQQNVLEPLLDVPELINFDPNLKSKSLLVSDKNSPYTYTQIKSSDYNWNYVVITYLQEYTYRLSDSRALLTTFFFILFLTAIIFAIFFSVHSFKPVQEIIKLLENPGSLLTMQKKTDKEIKYIAGQITSYIQTNKKLSDELNARLNLLNETKLLALQSQINPHFLFNSLNMIHILEIEALGYDHYIPKISLSLSKLMRYAIESTDLVSLETELIYTKLYISILYQRYGNKLQIEYSFDPETLVAKVPKLFIQPIIENAVFHGLSTTITEESKLIITCKHLGNFCILTITDNGIGMSSETLHYLREIIKEKTTPKENIGLKNIVLRMSLLYGDNFSMIIDSVENEGSTFTLRFPYL